MQFDPEQLRFILATIPCRNCGGVGGEATVEAEGPHFARIECASCGYWIDWLGWPRDRPSDRARRRPRITKLGEDRCESCLRRADELPSPERLEEHHVVEHAENGADEAENTRVYCSACHAHVRWLRTYFGHYHQTIVPA